MNKTKIAIISGTVISLITATILITRFKKTGPQVVKRTNGQQDNVIVAHSADGLATEVNEPNWQDPFDMNYSRHVNEWVNPKAIELNTYTADAYAKRIFKAKGKYWYHDDNEKVIEVIFGKELKDKVQVSNVSRAFYARYRTDLFNYLKGFLSSSELKKLVTAPVARLKNYTN
ncbi:MAG: hypothetical protein WBA74_17465 [Cyclobacteriaceae bacterium]